MRDQGDFNALCEEYSVALCSFFRKHGVAQDDVDDLIQETFSTLWRVEGRILDGKARGFLFGVARRVLLAHRRKSLSRIRDALNRQGYEPAPQASPLEAIIVHEQHGTLVEAIASLPEVQARVIRLKYLEGHTHPPK